MEPWEADLEPGPEQEHDDDEVGDDDHELLLSLLAPAPPAPHITWVPPPALC